MVHRNRLLTIIVLALALAGGATWASAQGAGAPPVQGQTLGRLGCTEPGDIARFDGAQWVCAGDVIALEVRVAALETALAGLQAAVATEEAARIAADNALQADLAAETAERIAAEAALQTAVDDEVAARLAGDAALQSAVDLEATNRAAADSALQDAVDAEATERAAADSVLQTAVDVEESNRAAADVALQDALDAEATERAAADSVLQTAIDVEESNRTAADVALQVGLGDLQTLLVHFSRDGDEIWITGANLHVVNGTGRTDSTNGLGNVIIGYNEEMPYWPNDRSGSHMLVLGIENEYSQYGGRYHSATGPYDWRAGTLFEDE